MRRLLFLLIPLSMASAAAAVPAVSSATPAGLDVLSPYAGRWHTEFHFLDTPYSQKSDSVIDLRNECWRSAGYFVCDQFVGGESKALIIYTYDAASGYTSFPIPVGAGEVHAGHMDVQGKVWTFPWKTAKDGKTVYFHVTNTWDTPDSIQFRQEYSLDGQQWVPMAEGHETRIRDVPASSKQP